jgi:hypothetical protein
MQKMDYGIVWRKCMVMVCPHCLVNVMVKEDGFCPHCKNNIFEHVDEVRAKSKSGPMRPAALPDDRSGSLQKKGFPLEAMFSVCIYVLMIALFAYQISRFDFDVISFFMIVASICAIVGIVSLVTRRRWSRRYNIVFQIVMIFSMLVIGFLMLVTGVLDWPGLLVICVLSGLESWVTRAFVMNKKVIAFFDGPPAASD